MIDALIDSLIDALIDALIDVTLISTMAINTLYTIIIFLMQILIATSTLAWGVNFPAHLVVVKGTEYYDGKTKRYVDFPITGERALLGCSTSIVYGIISCV